jgi:PilZ domain
MSPCKRRTPRRKVNVPVFLYTADGWPLGECRMRDISAGGARLTVLPANELPDELLLSLSRDGKVRRHCSLVWRNEEEIGVRFRPT